MQALAERLQGALTGQPLQRVALLGFSSLKTVVPPVDSLYGLTLDAVTRRAKYLVWTFAGGTRIVIHLSQAGRLDLESPPKTTKPRGSVARFFLADTAVLVREYGTQRKAAWWVLAADDEGPLEGLGPEPDSTAFGELLRTSMSNRRLFTDLRDQHFVAGIGRGWGDDILQRSRLSPFATLKSLSDEERQRLIDAVHDVLNEALTLERSREGGLSEAKLSGRFAVHGRFDQPCPTCGAPLRRVSFESYELAYCATCQTGGKVLADRRMSRLLK
jgi:formamidopyrimidine-DNA glycosylase